MIKKAYILDLQTGDKYTIPVWNFTSPYRIEGYDKEFACDMIFRFNAMDYRGGIYRPNRYRIVIEEGGFEK